MRARVAPRSISGLVSLPHPSAEGNGVGVARAPCDVGGGGPARTLAGGAPMGEPFRHVFVALMVPTMVKAIVEKFVPGAPMRCLVADALALWSREDVLENVAQGVHSPRSARIRTFVIFLCQ